MRIERLELEDHWGLVLTPTSHLRLGLDQVRLSGDRPQLSALDHKILDALGSAGTPASFVILRGASDDGMGSWRFSESTSQDELDELGYLMVRSQVLMWRCLALRGVTLLLKVEWGALEVDAIGAGAQRLVKELEAKAEGCDDPGKQALLRLDAWVVGLLSSSWLMASYQECRDSFLPRAVERTSARRVTMERLVADVPRQLLKSH